MVHGHGGFSHPLEVVDTVLEVADVAWKAMELRHHNHHHNDCADASKEEEEIASLRSENLRLRSVLDDNLKLLQHLSRSPSISKDCPSDLYMRLVATVDSVTFLTRLESLHQASLDAPTNNFPFKDATGDDLHSVEALVNIGLEEPSWWVWVTDEMVPLNAEERSGIDNESYVIVSEDQVVDGVANFIARCILSNPKAKDLTPKELQKTVTKALGGMNKLEKMFNIWHAGKLFYVLSTWGLAMTGLRWHRMALRVAAKGIGTSGKIIMKAL